MRKLAVLLIFALLMPLGLVLGGCGDTNLLEGFSTGSNSDSKMERAIEALDNADYDEAISLLSGLSDSDAKRKYLASAYLGKAGFDTLGLINELDKSSDDESDNSAFWGAAGALFDDEVKDGLLTNEQIAAKIALMNKALSVLFTGKTGNNWYALMDEEAPAKTVASAEFVPFSNMSDARLFQAGIASALNLLLKVSEQMHYDDSSVVIDPIKYIELIGGELPVTGEVPEGFIEELMKDLEILKLAVARIDAGEDNSLVEELNKFLNDIGYDDGVITQEELNGFLQSLVTPSEEV